ncbi:MAG: crosslink repair DNA glycosylase YcaQ family protein [Nesterenkonia sp.]|uniref:DNA glycosylase AlkZ-like family protein n=1 Tax=Nesterenkonia marinintestina TaxID=2979865 RepID=UPI0021C0886B|nr:crosslink repair DNA glycosylase YcaQ family protein [Nesterenkonia sp. GX14115]MDO5492432.1 crosslink repair DNA glycosylase YcaQ family protein [Nesterenkonia sp.]
MHTAEAVRAVVVAGQGIPARRATAADAPFGDAADVLRHVGLVQLDPLMRVSTAQRLTCLTRLPRRRSAEAVDTALWPAGVRGGERVGFEAFTKVACLFPVEDWPLLRLSRARHRDHAERVLSASERREILAVVADHPGGAPIGAIETGAGPGVRTAGWNWSEVKKAAELMVRAGELVITAREGTTRLFDLPERGLPAEVLEADGPGRDGGAGGAGGGASEPDDELLAGLARRALGTMVVATEADVAHHYHLSPTQAATGVRAAGLVPVTIAGWRAPGWCTAEVAEQLGRTDPGDGEAVGPAGEARLIGPFDPLLRDRRRASRILGFDYLFEAYVPAAKRVYGHYVMGVLSGSRMVARADVQRVGDTLRINGIFPERGIRRRSAEARTRAAAETLAAQLGAADVALPDAVL